MLSVKVSTKHQIVVPSEARRDLGIEAGDRLDVQIADGAIVLRKRPDRPSDRLRGLATGRGWYEPDADAYVREIRAEWEERTRAREALVGGGHPAVPREDRDRQQRADLPARGKRHPR